MSEQTYPYIAWVLTPSFKPKQVEIVRPYGYNRHSYQQTMAGKTYHVLDLFASEQAAIAAGFTRCDDQQATIDKRQAALDKRRRALEAAQKSA